MPCLYLQDILFPYIRDQLEDYLSTHWEEDECKQDVHLLKKQVEWLESCSDGQVILTIHKLPWLMARWTLIIINNKYWSFQRMETSRHMDILNSFIEQLSFSSYLSEIPYILSIGRHKWD